MKADTLRRIKVYVSTEADSVPNGSLPLVFRLTEQQSGQVVTVESSFKGPD